MPEKFKTSRRIEFRDTDAAGIVHFSNFFVFMEQAEHTLLRHLGMSVMGELDGQQIGWPRVSATCNYQSPARFEDLIEIQMGVLRMGTSSIKYGFEFKLDEQPIADGTLTTVCCLHQHGKPFQSQPIPKSFVTKISPYLVDPE